MLIALLSDIHANLEALDAVLEDASQHGPGGYLCLGDVIGYGPDPQAVVEKLMALDVPTVVGNHDYAVRQPNIMHEFNDNARTTLKHNLKHLSFQARLWLNALPSWRVEQGARLAHGLPPDDFMSYARFTADTELRHSFSTYAQRLCFVGHSHDWGIYILHPDDELQRDVLSYGEYKLPRDSRCIVNIGSVGQPRNNARRAQYALWDVEGNRLHIKTVAYDTRLTAQKCQSLDFPDYGYKWLLE